MKVIDHLKSVQPGVTVLEMDFATKTERQIDPSEIAPGIAAGRFVWIDVQGEVEESRALLRRLDLLDDDTIESCLRCEPAVHYERHESHLNLLVCTYTGEPQGSLALERLSATLSENYLVTFHQVPSPLVRSVRANYRSDFLRFAQTPSFLIYELWDQVLDRFLQAQKIMGDHVERLQLELHTMNVDDAFFQRHAVLSSQLLHFRTLLLPTRTVLCDMATRRSALLSETTQRFLLNMVGTVDHLIEDMLADRDILSNSLNLHMSMTAHRTSRVMHRLTSVSFVFLPLTFLVGVYGMNFRVLPELEWRYGYAYFWAVTASLTLVISFFLRRTRL